MSDSPMQNIIDAEIRFGIYSPKTALIRKHWFAVVDPEHFSAFPLLTHEEVDKLEEFFCDECKRSYVMYFEQQIGHAPFCEHYENSKVKP